MQSKAPSKVSQREVWAHNPCRLSTGSVQRNGTPQLWFVIGRQTRGTSVGEDTQAFKANIMESFTSFYTRVCCKMAERMVVSLELLSFLLKPQAVALFCLIRNWAMDVYRHCSNVLECLGICREWQLKEKLYQINDKIWHKALGVVWNSQYKRILLPPW